LIDPSRITWMFDGLRSRWMTPCACAAAERGGELPADRADFSGRQRPARQVRGEADPLHVLHDDERAALLFEDVVHAGDVGMRETRDRASFAQDTGVAVGRGAALRGQALERDAAFQSRVVTEKDLAHAAAPSFSRIW
jgi:hypothetical protein